MSLFFFHQQTSESPWVLAPESYRAEAAKTARYTTILSITTPVADDTPAEELAALRYVGPFYADWDAADINVAIAKFQQFLGGLEDRGVDLGMVSLYATGGRGFHCEIPMALFIEPVPKGGVQSLPLLYREMAYQMYTDAMDLRVYSTKRGRMWRSPNVQRENGAYKVQITADDAFAMDEEMYQRLCAQPRPLLTPTAPKLNNALAVLYAQALEKVKAGVKRRKDSKKDVELLTKYNGQFPATLQTILRGEGIAEDASFNAVALQVCITAHALGKSWPQLEAEAAGLIACDLFSGRYSNPRRRHAELERMYYYTEDNVCYNYAIGGVKSILADGVNTADLDGIKADDGELTLQEREDDDGLLGGVFMTRAAVYAPKENGIQAISNMTYGDILIMLNARTGEVVALEADMYLEGMRLRRKDLELGTFTSKSKMHAFCLQHMGMFSGGDNQVSALFTLLRRQAMQSGQVLYATNREGLDLIPNPDAEGGFDVAWVAPTGVITAGTTRQYQFRGMPKRDGHYQTDLMNAPDVPDVPHMHTLLDNLLRVNEPRVVASLIGWIAATFQKQFLQEFYGGFPLMQIFGEAGAGKTATVKLLQGFYYYVNRPVSANVSSTTKFALQVALWSSCSVPCVLEEFKPREMRQDHYHTVLDLLRTGYDSGVISKGGMSDNDLTASWRDVRNIAISAPIVFVGTGMESQTEIMERTIYVPLKKLRGEGMREAFIYCRDHRRDFASIGKAMARAALNTDYVQFRAVFDRNHKQVDAVSSDNVPDRVRYNIAVLLTGFDFFTAVVAVYFPDLVAKLDNLRGALLDVGAYAASTVMSEPAKVLNTLSLITHTEEATSEFGLLYGQDFVVNAHDHLEIKMRPVYVKYVAWCRRKGQTPLYDTEAAFLTGMGNYAGVIDKFSGASVLKDSGLAKVYTYDQGLMEKDGVEAFKVP